MNDLFTFTPTFPLAAIWEVTQKCNLQCVHCSSSGGKEPAGELSPADALHLVDELAASLRIYRLVLSGGEPLLRRDIFSIIEKAATAGLKVSLFTNGTLLTDSILTRLDKLGLDYLQIGISGITDETHTTLSHSKSLDTIFDTFKRAKTYTFKVGLSVPVHKKTYTEVLNKIDILLNLEPDALCLSRFVPTGRGALFADELLLSQEKRRNLALFGQHLRDEGYTIILDEPLTDPHGCQAGISLCCISPTGDVYPCPLLRVSCGNITSGHIAELWKESQLINALKNRMVKGQCGECTMKEQCGGCRSLAFYFTGDYLASDPQCWRT